MLRLSPLGRLALSARGLIERLHPRGSQAIVERALRSAQGEITVTLATGVRMRVSLEDRVQRLCAFGLYERPELDLMRSLLGPGATMLDLGAHTGTYALHAARAVGPTGAVYAFEPLPSNAERLRVNVGLNGFTQCTVVQSAVSDVAGRAPFQSVEVGGESGWGSMVIDASAVTHAIEVDVVTVDGFAQANGLGRVDLIKLDIQGSELQALRGAEHVLRTSRPHVLCEVVDVYWGSGQTTTAADLAAFMTDLGYRSSPVAPRSLNTLFRAR